MPKEAKARILINDCLLRSNWRFFDDEKGPANVALEINVKLHRQSIEGLGDDFEKTANGFIDYLLLDTRGFPVAVLEAKSEKYDPLVGKEQARKYARAQNVRFVILSNGNLHYFWDLEHGNPTLITEFPTPDSLGHFHAFRPNPDKLVNEKVESGYVAITQNANYQSDPRWTDSGLRDAYIKDAELKFLRPYQLGAVTALQDAVHQGQTRFLFEMATGTGKTLTAAALIKLFMRTGNAKRVLFLVDRLELEEQARKRFVQFLRNDFTTVVYKENRDDWRKAEIVVSTVQSLQFNNKYRSLFSPTDFDGLISRGNHKPHVYWMLKKAVEQVEENLHGGVGLVRITKANLERIEIPVPPLKEQERLAAELEGYRKVIEAARQVVTHYKPTIRTDPDWEMKPIGTIAEVQLGKMLDKAKHRSGHLLAYLRNVNVRWGAIDTSDLLEMYFEDDELERFGLRAGDVLVCEGGEPGRAAVWDGRMPDLKYQKALHRVRFRVPYEPQLLVCWLQALAKSKDWEERFQGATIKHFTREMFIELPVPVPPLPDQRQIVAEIEAEMKLVDANRELIVRMEKKIQAKLAEIWGEAAEVSE